MNPVEKHRWFQFTAKVVRIAVTLAVLGVIMAQYRKNSRLEADINRLESSNTALLSERDDLKWRAEAWEKEAVEWRVKNGVPEPFVTTPLPPADSNRPAAPLPAEIRPYGALVLPPAADKNEPPPNWGGGWINGQRFYIVPLASPR